MVKLDFHVGLAARALVVRSVYVGPGGGLAALSSSKLVSESTPTPHAARHNREERRRVFMATLHCNAVAIRRAHDRRALGVGPVGVSGNGGGGSDPQRICHTAGLKARAA